MPLSSVFPPIALSDTELEVVHELLKTPILRTYLTMMARVDAKDIVLGEPADNESADSYLRRQATVKGRLEVFATLLSVA